MKTEQLWPVRLTCINISKCSVLSIHHNSKDSIPHPYYINGMQLSNTSSVTDLGIVVDSRLSFNIHISNILAKATQRVGVFFRGFSSRHPELMRKAFITRAILVVAVVGVLWHPVFKLYLLTSFFYLSFVNVLAGNNKMK